MAENSQIPRRGYILLKGRIEQNLGGVSKVGSGPRPNRWLNCWLSVTIGPNQRLNCWMSVTIASIQLLKKVGCTPIHFWKRSPGVVFILTF